MSGEKKKKCPELLTAKLSPRVACCAPILIPSAFSLPKRHEMLLKEPQEFSFWFFGGSARSQLPHRKCPQPGHCFHPCFHNGFGSNPALVVVFFNIILGALFFLSPYKPHSWETWEMGRMLHGIRRRLTQVGIIFTDEPLG